MAKEPSCALSVDELGTVSGGGALVERTDGDLSVKLGFGEVTGTTASGGLFQGTWSPVGNSLFTNNQVSVNVLTGEGELGVSAEKGGYIEGEGSLIGVEAQTTLGGWLPVGASLEMGTASAQASTGEGIESKVTALEADVSVGSITGDPDAGVAPNALAVGLGLNLAQASMENGRPTSRLDGDAQLADVDGDGWADVQASVTVPLGNLASVDISVGLNTGTTIDNTVAAAQWVGDQAVAGYDAAVAGATALGDSIASGWDALTTPDPAASDTTSPMDGLNPMGDYTGYDSAGITDDGASADDAVRGLQDDMQADQQLAAGLDAVADIDAGTTSIPQDAGGWGDMADSDFGSSFTGGDGAADIDAGSSGDSAGSASDDAGGWGDMADSDFGSSFDGSSSDDSTGDDGGSLGGGWGDMADSDFGSSFDGGADSGTDSSWGGGGDSGTDSSWGGGSDSGGWGGGGDSGTDSSWGGGGDGGGWGGGGGADSGGGSDSGGGWGGGGGADSGGGSDGGGGGGWGGGGGADSGGSSDSSSDSGGGWGGGGGADSGGSSDSSDSGGGWGGGGGADSGGSSDSSSDSSNDGATGLGSSSFGGPR